MGATDPAKAAPGSIRKELGTSIQNNCTHGSDAPETAAFETGYFFAGYELVLRRRPGNAGPPHRRPLFRSFFLVQPIRFNPAITP